MLAANISSADALASGITKGQWRSGIPVLDHLYTASTDTRPCAALATAAGPPASLISWLIPRMPEHYTNQIPISSTITDDLDFISKRGSKCYMGNMKIGHAAGAKRPKKSRQGRNPEAPAWAREASRLISSTGLKITRFVDALRPGLGPDERRRVSDKIRLWEKGWVQNQPDDMDLFRDIAAYFKMTEQQLRYPAGSDAAQSTGQQPEWDPREIALRVQAIAIAICPDLRNRLRWSTERWDDMVAGLKPPTSDDTRAIHRETDLPLSYIEEGKIKGVSRGVLAKLHDALLLLGRR